MTVSFTHLEPPSETTFLRERVARLRGSLEWAGEAIRPRVRERVLAAVELAEQRLALGVDHTIVALAGGTGSGKSSLFNAVTGTDFAIPGVSRPTTAQVSAAAWGAEAGPLLDWLGVEPQRRAQIEAQPPAEGAAPQPHPLRGMVLLDLPDHDSVNRANRGIVDRVVPMADLVVWVVDPQKYADNALHSTYLKAVAENKAPSAVVLNHADRLPQIGRDAVIFDIHRLLEECGIQGVPVLTTSAATGAGVESLRSVLAAVVAKRSVAAEAVRADLVAAGKVVAEALSTGAQPRLPDAAQASAELARAAGVDARAEATGAVAAGRAGSVPPLATLTASAVEAVRGRWIDEATQGLPTQWRKVLTKAVPRARAIADAVNQVLAEVPWEPVEPVKRRWWKPAPKGIVERDRVLEVGRGVVGMVVEQLVTEPTRTVHQAYRALDELATLKETDDLGEPEEPEATSSS